MNEPTIGDESFERPGTCSFAVVHGMPKCGAPATRHIFSESAIYGFVSLPTCEDHAPFARAAGPFIGEHPYTVDCSGRWTFFHHDRCTPEGKEASR